MFFELSKLFWFAVAPSHLLLWLVIATAVLLYLKKERAGRWCAIAAAVWFVVIAVLPTGVWLMRPIEDRFPRPDWPAHVDGILVLGGAEGGPILHARGVIHPDSTETRVVAGFELAQRYPTARVVFSGGSVRADGRFPAAQGARYIFGQMGLTPPRLILEDKSRNTWENFVFSKRLVNPRTGETWMLVTSANHMPRAMAIAARVGWKMIPWPSDYTTAHGVGNLPFDLSTNLRTTDWAVHEWIGLMVYRLDGKASATH